MADYHERQWRARLLIAKAELESYFTHKSFHEAAVGIAQDEHVSGEPVWVGIIPAK